MRKRNVRALPNKPNYGLWASKKDDEWGWKNWSETEGYHVESLDTSFEFTISESAKILEISESAASMDMLRKYIDKSSHQNYLGMFMTKINFEKIIEDGYDAIIYNHSSIKFGSCLWGLFYGWDCNCILILNPEIVEV